MKHAATAAEAVSLPAGPEPAVILLACDWTAATATADAVRLSRRWPLAGIFSLTTSLTDGRRRGGTEIPGIPEVAWHDLPARLPSWQAALAGSLHGPLGLPATIRREERLAAGIEAAARYARQTEGFPPVSREVITAANRRIDLDGLAGLLEAGGFRVTDAILGRPERMPPASTLVWDAGCLGPDDFAAVARLRSGCPAGRIIVLESFPRGGSVRAMLAAGGTLVLGRPVAADLLWGGLEWALARGESGPREGLGTAAGGR